MINDWFEGALVVWRAFHDSLFPFVAIILSFVGGVWALATLFLRRRVEPIREALADSERRLQAVLSGPYAHILVDSTEADWPIVWADSRFEKMTGYSAKDAIGRNARFLQGEDRDQEALKELRRAMKELRETRVLLRNYRKDGTPFWNELHVSPIRNEQGRIVYFSGVLQDVTEREQNQRRLATQLSVIRALSESPAFDEAVTRILEAFCLNQGWDIGAFWMVDQAQNVLRCLTHWHAPELDVEQFEMFCRENPQRRAGGFAGFLWARGEPLWVENLSKEADFPEVAFLQNVRTLSACGFPVVNREGIQGVFVFYSRRMWPLNKNLMLLMVGTSSQICQFHERATKRDGNAEKPAVERVLAEFMADGMMVMDRDGFCIFANPAAARLLAGDPSDYLGFSVHDRLHPPSSDVGRTEPCTSETCALLAALDATSPRRGEEPIFFTRRDGQPLPVTYTTSPILDHGAIRGIVLTFHDASTRLAAEETWRHQLELKETALQKALEEGERLRKLLSDGENERDQSSDESAEPATPGAQGTLLLIEEDKALRMKTANILRRRGYRVVPAANAGEALLICERSSEPITYLVTDVMLTHMTGQALAQRLATLHPGLKTVFTSTYTLDALVEMRLLEPGAAFLQKPLQANRLQEALRRLAA